MSGIMHFEAFLLAGILLNLTPGADTMYVLGRSISQGKTAGLLSAIGISTGSLIHTILAAFGLSIVLAQSAWAFGIVKYAGGIYLIYLGIQAFRTKAEAMDLSTSSETRKARVYFSAVLTNVLNPKVALFYLAFLPQFIDPAGTETTWAFLLLGLTFTATGTLWALILAFFAAKMAEKFRQNPQIRRWLYRITGTVFLYLGIRLICSRR